MENIDKEGSERERETEHRNRDVKFELFRCCMAGLACSLNSVSCN
jgi:hypothetical protein